jgi:uncharacterized protein YerC
MTTPPARDALHDALLSMRTRAEIDAFLADLCTPADAGGKSYREIAAEAHASPTTVVRVARYLKDMPHQGYRIALDRLKA